MPRRNGRKSGKNEGDVDLDALVAAIEGTHVSSKCSKQGMTRKQAKALQDREMDVVLGKARAVTEPSLDERRKEMALLTQRLIRETAERDEQAAKVRIPLRDEQKAWQKVSDTKYIRYEQFDGDDEAMDFIVQLFARELTEPYSSFTYEYFVFGWPDLTIIAHGYEGEVPPDDSVKGIRVGAVVSRVSRKRVDGPLRGYVAMFAVIKEFRGFRLGSRLVALTIDLMREKGCEEAYLETPTSNERALSLYLALGFVKYKFLPRYYLDHSDAIRLKLWLKDPFTTTQEQETKVEAASGL